MTVLALPPVLDLPAAAPLLDALRERRGADLDLDAAAVERLGGLCLQVLLSARRSWAEDNRRLRLVTPSAPCRDALRLAGAMDAMGLPA